MVDTEGWKILGYPLLYKEVANSSNMTFPAVIGKPAHSLCADAPVFRCRRAYPTSKPQLAVVTRPSCSARERSRRAINCIDWDFVTSVEPIREILLPIRSSRAYRPRFYDEIFGSGQTGRLCLDAPKTTKVTPAIRTSTDGDFRYVEAKTKHDNFKGEDEERRLPAFMAAQNVSQSPKEDIAGISMLAPPLPMKNLEGRQSRGIVPMLNSRANLAFHHKERCGHAKAYSSGSWENWRQKSGTDLVAKISQLPDGCDANRDQKQRTTPVSRNKQGRRLDEAIDGCSGPLVESLEHLGVCNNWFLKRYCKFESHCRYLHGEQTRQMVQAVRFLARRSPCRRGTRCDVPDCYAGHHCKKHITDKRPEGCKFGDEMHFTDVVPVSEEKNSNSEA